MATSLWRKIWTAAMLVLATVAAAAEQVEVRVRQTPGGPQIFVDGNGEQALLFPAPSTVRDGLTGELLGTGVVRLPVTLRTGEVRVFTMDAIFRYAR